MSSEKLLMNFELETTSGAILRPIALKEIDATELIQSPKGGMRSSTSNLNLESMAHYLVGLSYAKLRNLMSPNSDSATSASASAFANLAWKTLDPHFELYWRTQTHLRDLLDQHAQLPADRIHELEKALETVLQQAVTPKRIDLHKLADFLNRISGFEQRANAPLLYNFSLKFSTRFIEILHTLYSFLFHIRCLVATHHNSKFGSNAFKVLRVDSLSDYLPSAEFEANDAALYWSFKKYCQPFIGHKSSDARIEKLLIEPMQKAFDNWAHNACHLIENIPHRLRQDFKVVGSENELYRIQMDWLLGAPSGLLFRVREELYGLSHGYEQIFWTDASEDPILTAEPLFYSFALNEHELFGNHPTVA